MKQYTRLFLIIQNWVCPVLLFILIRNCAAIFMEHRFQTPVSMHLWGKEIEMFLISTVYCTESLHVYAARDMSTLIGKKI